MNTQMAYLIGMILGNGEVQRKSDTTTITVELPHKNLIDDEGREVSVYVKSSLADIRGIVEPLIGYSLPISQTKRATQFSFTMPNADYTMREILRFIGNGVHHSTMTMNDELFGMKTDEKKEDNDESEKKERSEKKEKVNQIDKKDSVSLKWGTGKTTFSEKISTPTSLFATLSQQAKSSQDAKKETEKEDVVLSVFQFFQYHCRCV